MENIIVEEGEVLMALMIFIKGFITRIIVSIINKILTEIDTTNCTNF